MEDAQGHVISGRLHHARQPSIASLPWRLQLCHLQPQAIRWGAARMALRWPSPWLASPEKNMWKFGRGGDSQCTGGLGRFL